MKIQQVNSQQYRNVATTSKQPNFKAAKTIIAPKAGWVYSNFLKNDSYRYAIETAKDCITILFDSVNKKVYKVGIQVSDKAPKRITTFKAGQGPEEYNKAVSLIVDSIKNANLEA